MHHVSQPMIEATEQRDLMMYFLKALLKWFNKSPAIDH